MSGKQLILADSLSRNPLHNIGKDTDDLHAEVDYFVNFIIGNLPAKSHTLDKIAKEQDKDATCKKLKEYCSSTWPAKNRTLVFYSYYKHKNKISVCDRVRIRIELELLMYNSRLIIPPSMQLELLSKIHEEFRYKQMSRKSQTVNLMTRNELYAVTESYRKLPILPIL